MYTCYIVEKCTSTQAQGIGGLLANTLYLLKIEVTVSVLLCLDSSHLPSAT